MCYYFPQELTYPQRRETGGRNDRNGRRRGAALAGRNGRAVALLPFLFFPLLGFGGAAYLDGSPAAR